MQADQLDKLVQYAVLPVWDVLQTAPHDLAAHGEANEVNEVPNYLSMYMMGICIAHFVVFII
jgi:hypothetical protein